jgi:hypothetical protein
MGRSKYQNPKYIRTGVPDLMICRVNSVDAHGEANGAICRDRWGRLCGVAIDGYMFPVKEKIFTEFLKKQEDTTRGSKC